MANSCHPMDCIACLLSRLSHVRLWATLWTVAHQAPLYVGFSRQEYWSWLHALLHMIFPTQGWNPGLWAVILQDKYKKINGQTIHLCSAIDCISAIAQFLKFTLRTSLSLSETPSVCLLSSSQIISKAKLFVILEPNKECDLFQPDTAFFPPP